MKFLVMTRRLQRSLQVKYYSFSVNICSASNLPHWYKFSFKGGCAGKEFPSLQMSGSFRKPFLNLKSTGEFQKINLTDKQGKITAH